MLRIEAQRKLENNLDREHQVEEVLQLQNDQAMRVIFQDSTFTVNAFSMHLFKNFFFKRTNSGKQLLHLP